MSQKLTAQDLEKKLHAAADILRKYLNAAENYKLVLPLLFVKRLNDNFIEIAEKMKKEGLGEKEAYENRRRHTFFVPEKARFSKLEEAESDVGNKINEVFREIERANLKLEGILVNAEFANTDKYTDDALREIIKIFTSLNLGDSNLENEDVFGDAYEYLLEEFAGETKKKGGQFYTPRQVVRLMVNLVAPKPGMRICDPACGSGGMLIHSRKYIEKNYPNEEVTNLTLEGQETNPDTFGICKMNLVVHGVTSFNIELGDVLKTPKLLDGGKLKTYDKVLANFPFSEDWNNTNAAKDPYKRFAYGIPPSKDKADFAFIQHMFSCLNEKGMAAIVASQGVLFRGNEEKNIREKMILGDEKEGLQGDIIESIIGLPPAIFYGTPIPGCILILNRNKLPERKNKILFYYAAHKDDYLEKPNRNILREEDISKITSAFRNFEDIDGRCHVADLEEIKENGFNLNVSRYVDISEPEEIVDIGKTIKELTKTEEEWKNLDVQVKRDLKELGIDTI